jgi:CRP-like cAMP-binding protein
MHDLRTQLLHGQWFRQLPIKVQDSLLALARTRELAPGQCLFQRGDAPCGLYAVLEGAMRVGRSAARARRRC